MFCMNQVSKNANHKQNTKNGDKVETSAKE